MRHRISLVTAVIALCILSALFLFGCADIVDIYTIDSTDYGLYANYTYSDGSNRSAFDLRGKSGEYVDITWDSPVTFNTLLIRERGSHVKEFEITIGDSAAPVYRQDEVGALRMIYLGNVSASKLRIKVTSSDGEFRLTDLGIYNVPRNRNFAITDMYLIDPESDNYLDPDSDFSSFSSSTDIILTGEAFTYDKDGNIDYDAVKLVNAVKRLKSLNSGGAVHVLLRPAETEDDGAVDVLNSAMDDHESDFRENIVSLLYNSGADGIVLDLTEHGDIFSHGIYNDFVESVRGRIPSPYKLSVYVNSDVSVFNDASKSHIDTFYVISHGDDSNNFASFSAFTRVLEKMYEHGIPPAKVQISIPLFGICTDDESGETATFAYGDEEIRKHMDLFDNIVDLHDKNIVFNGYTLVKDKTAFAYGYDMQGVVLIDYDKDAANYQYSLHNAVQSALR